MQNKGFETPQVCTDVLIAIGRLVGASLTKQSNKDINKEFPGGYLEVMVKKINYLFIMKGSHYIGYNSGTKK